MKDMLQGCAIGAGIMIIFIHFDQASFSTLAVVGGVALVYLGIRK